MTRTKRSYLQPDLITSKRQLVASLANEMAEISLTQYTALYIRQPSDIGKAFDDRHHRYAETIHDETINSALDP